MHEVMWDAVLLVCEPRTLAIIVISAVYGIFVGSIPGLTATMATALIVPLTFFLSDVEAVAAIVTTVTCSIFAGDIPATLVRIPGTPASAAYAADAYALTQRGLAQRALTTSLTFSTLGGLFGVLVLAVAAPQLATVATRFTSYEYFWLYVLGLTCAAIVSDEARLKGALALMIGIQLSTVGLGTDYSVPRLTFGVDELITGINFIPAMIGLFGVSEIFRNVLTMRRDGQVNGSIAAEPRSAAATTDGFESSGVIAFTARRIPQLLRSSTIGSLVGMLPGAGADIAAWISYAVSKRFSKRPEEYGRGSLEGLADATGANNAALGSAWIPALVFGIPGDSITAIAIGVLLMKNITPGPDIFDAEKHPEQAVLVGSIFVTFVLANLLLIPIGLAAIRTGTVLIRIPRRILLPAIMLFCIVGSYAMYGSYFDVWVMLAMGLLGFVLEKQGVPLGPVVLGIILGSQVEHVFIQCITKSSSLAAFFASPLSIGLGLISVALWLGPAILSLARRSD
jgi:putative tricarboxylic transport membrane protein